MAITPSQWSHVLTIPESYTPSAATSGQTLVITESVIAKLSAGDQATFWSNVQNGGGDVRICTSEDGTNQLPVEIVSLDNSSQKCVIWTRKPSYDGTGNLHLFIGKAGETQPPVADPFGRNAVWQDKEFHNNFDGNVVDSTGVSSFTESSVTYTAGKIGQAVSIGAIGSHVEQETGFTPLGLDDFRVSFWVRTSEPSNSNLKPIFGTTMTSDGSDEFGGTWMMWLQNGRITFYLSNSGADSVENPKIVTDGSWHYVVARRISGVISLTVDNNAPVTKPSTRNLSSTLNSNRYGLSGRWASFIGDIDSSTLERGIVEDDYIATEYANQNDPATFYGTPTLATTGAPSAGFTASVTETAVDFSESSALSITANITTQITESSSDFSESSSTTITNNLITISVTEISQDFSESASASISGSLDAIVTELSQSFTESSSADISANISAAVTELAQDFDESAQVNLIGSFTVEVTEMASDFEEACYIQLPVQRLIPRKVISVNNRSGSIIRVRRRSSVIRVK